MQLFDHPYAAFLGKVEKPTRYTGQENGTRKKPWSDVQARVCLAFPDVYDIGMSHLGYRILYKILNDDPRTLAERCYTPWTDMVGQLRKHGELLRSLESQRPLCDFDVVGFSLQFELTFTNILLMLDLSGIPLRSANRGDHDPLIVAGGPVATHAEPMAMFLDAIVVGDGEEVATEIALLWTDLKRQGKTREERLRALSKLEGVYVPSLYSRAPEPGTGIEVVEAPTDPEITFPIKRRLIRDLAAFPFPDDGPVGGPEAIFERMSIEVARGCTEGCRFCQAGMIYRPVRERPPEEVIATVERALQKSGQDEVSLTALSTADVSCITPMIRKLAEKTAPERVSLSVASLRAYGLAEDLLDDMRRVRAAGLTFAPEAGTQRMRDVINKNVTEAQLLETAERVFTRGFDKMKLYFILGLPTERDEDLRGIVQVGQNAIDVAKRVKNRRAKVTVSVSTHVPKPHTPFQWCAMDSLEEIKRKQALLREEMKGKKGVGLRLHDSETSVLEGILARGDYPIGNVIEGAYLRGACFDSWDEHAKMDAWEAAFVEHNVETSKYLGTLPVDARLPWSHLDIGLEPGFLAREYRRALKDQLSPPCGKPKGMFVHHTNLEDATADQKKLVCYNCGIACDMKEMREERIGFLQTMGAEKRDHRVHMAVLQEKNAAGGQRPKKDPERYRPLQSGGEADRWRLRFSKTGPMALLGHLDLIREIPRGIRRAGVRTAYTKGFRPKPDMMFGPALSLGVASVSELVDLRLIGAPDREEFLARLNAGACNGVRFLDAVKLGPNDPALSKVLDESEYVIGIPETTLLERGGKGALENAVATFLAAPSLVVMRKIDGLGKKLDVRAFVQALSVGDASHLGKLRAAGIIGNLVPLFARIGQTPRGSIKVAELVEAVFGAKHVPHVALRTRLLASGHDLLDVAAFRKPTVKSAAPEATAAAETAAE